MLTITKPRYLTSDEHLEEFITLSAELFQAALRTPHDGNRVRQRRGRSTPKSPTPSSRSARSAASRWPADLVYCGGCQTPHHRECWEYFGGCSTYACGHKQ